MTCPPTPTARASEAGLTLVEMLVILALVGLLAGTVSLSLSRLGTGPSLSSTAETLASRLRIAAETAALTGYDAAFSWNDGAYRFLNFEGGEWEPHTLAELGRIERLPGSVDLAVEGQRQGSLRLSADLAPPEPAPLTVLLTERGNQVMVIFDGLDARSHELEP